VPASAAREVARRAQEALQALKKAGSRATIESYPRYGISVTKAYGVPMGAIQRIAKGSGKDHALAEALWRTGVYEARLLAAFVAEPERLTRRRMDAWAKDFDNWGVCDTVAFHLFDRSPHALACVTAWATRKEEFVKRAAFALLASIALHDRSRGDADFTRHLRAIERAAVDERNFVKKGVSWALRGIGGRSPALHAASLETARRLAASADAPARWVGHDALRDLSRPLVARRAAGAEKRRRAVGPEPVKGGAPAAR
jgi:3-methyladenine DNA glycosylase AlkD